MTESVPVAVLGAGSWGTALAVHLCAGGRRTVLWARSSEFAATMRASGENARYLPGIELPEALEVTAELADLHSCSVALIVVPSHGFRAVLRSYLRAGDAGRSTTLVSATKGIEGDSLARMSEVCEEEARSAGRPIRFAVLSGPSFAGELARGVPTAAVVASADLSLAARLQGLLSGPSLRLYTTDDVVGVELGGAIKNVIAIAAGVVSGLGLGENTRAALITRGLHELTTLGLACGGRAETFAGLAGLGDLVLTCTSAQSRNQRLGESLATGHRPEELESETSMVAEGIRNSRAILELARRRGVEMPITEQMVAVLYEAKPPQLAVEELMTRTLKSESER